MRDHQASQFDVPAWDALALMRTCEVGRLCVIDHGTPLALPVNFKVDAQGSSVRIVVRTSPTGLLGSAEGPASFEVDHIDARLERAWSVIARGSLRRTQHDPTLPDPEPWVAGNRYQWLVLDVASISARRFTAAAAADGFAVEWTLEPVTG